MNNLINYISSGVGAGKRKSRKSVLVRLGSSRTSDVLLSSDSDSSDEEYLPETKKWAIGRLKTDANRDVAKKKKQRTGGNANGRQNNRKRNKISISKTVSFVAPEPACTYKESWSHHIPEEMLLKIFQIAITKNEHGQRLLIRASKVCRLWRRIACDPTLWHSLDLSYGWITSPILAIKALAQEGRLIHLLHLNVSGCKQMNKSFMQVIVDEFRQLKSLNISNCNSLNTEGLQLIAQLPHIENFSATGLIVNSQKSAILLDILSRNREWLRKVELASKNWICCSSKLLRVLSSLTGLTVLDVSEIAFPSNPLLAQTLKAIAPTIQILRMSRCTIKTHMIICNEGQVCLSCPKLVEFTAAEAMLISSFPLSFFVKNAPRLKHLDVRGWFADGLDCINEIDVWPVLQTLNVRGVDLSRTRTMFSFSKYVEGLEELDISWLKGSTEVHAVFSGIVNLLPPESNLKALYCAGTSITMNQLRRVLTNCPNLHTIDLESCRSVTRGLKRLHSASSEINALRKQV